MNLCRDKKPIGIKRAVWLKWKPIYINQTKVSTILNRKVVREEEREEERRKEGKEEEIGGGGEEKLIYPQ